MHGNNLTSLVREGGKREMERYTGSFNIKKYIFLKAEAKIALMCLGDRYIERSTLEIGVVCIILFFGTVEICKGRRSPILLYLKNDVSENKILYSENTLKLLDLSWTFFQI